jgi:hypothetical protein
MYQQFLWVHSWLRWVVLAVGFLVWLHFCYAWMKKRNWNPFDHSLVLVFTQVLSFQVGIGCVLYFGISPIPKSAFLQKEWMKDAILRFWTIEHPLVILVAYFVFLLGKQLAYKRKTNSQRHAALALTLASTYILILTAIPWPNLIQGRPLFR